MRKLFFIISSLMILCSCAIDPGHKRDHPSLKGFLYRDGLAVDNAEILYAGYYDKYCREPLYRTRSDKSGYFEVVTPIHYQLTETVKSGCYYENWICFVSDGNKRRWKIRINGIGEVEYHTGAKFKDNPERIFLQEKVGDCVPPEWIKIECDMSKRSDTCKLI